MGVAERVRAAALALRRDVAGLRFAAPVTHVYNPLDYAMRAHSEYIRRFARASRRVVFLGMNPGPFGMAQTGIPFGEVSAVRDWMGIEARIDRPAREHPKRPILGFHCTRREVSGQRLWGAIAAHYGSPEAFFRQHYVANYCPLVFMEESGKNRTPDKLPAPERDALYACCDRHLARLVRVLEPEWVVGIGAFATARARAVLRQGPGIANVLHPSPASPRANRGWARQARSELQQAGICRA